jgi:phosphoglucosamine mutase
VREAVGRAEAELGQRGRVVLRASGTEPVIRVMVEGEDKQQVDALAGRLAESVRSSFGN